MKKEFYYGGCCYVVSFENNEFSLYIDTTKSSPEKFIDKDSLEFQLGDVPPDMVFSKTKSKDYFKIYSDVKKFIDYVIKSKRPYYFFYVANEKSKIRIYKKFAEILANKYKYYLVDTGYKFYFYKRHEYGQS